jgi:hypothetical protein
MGTKLMGLPDFCFAVSGCSCRIPEIIFYHCRYIVMRQPRFKIYHSSLDEATARQTNLYVEIAHTHVELLAVSPDDKVMGLESYAIAEQESLPESLQTISQSSRLMQMSCRHTGVFINVAESILMPENLFETNNDVSAHLNVVYGFVDKAIQLNDQMRSQQIANVYRINPTIQAFIDEYFAMAVVKHSYTPLIESATVAKDNDAYIKLVFYSKEFIVLVFKQNQLQLAQTYHFQVPEDVSYFTLNICKQFDLDTKQVQIEVEGMIDLVSPLYVELEKYFLHVATSANPNKLTLEEEFLQSPYHYFAPTLNLIA